MKNANRDVELDELIDGITTDANGEAEQLWAFRQAFEDNVAVPCEASVIGEPVQVLRFDYDGNEQRGLTAVCRRADGTKHVVTASELVIPPRGYLGEREGVCWRMESSGILRRRRDPTGLRLTATIRRGWSGRPDSNPRRPAWENDRRFKIKNDAVYGVSARFKDISNFLVS